MDYLFFAGTPCSHSFPCILAIIVPAQYFCHLNTQSVRYRFFDAQYWHPEEHWQPLKISSSSFPCSIFILQLHFILSSPLIKNSLLMPVYKGRYYEASLKLLGKREHNSLMRFQNPRFSALVLIRPFRVAVKTINDWVN